MNVPGGALVKMWTQGVPVEDEAREQLARTARMPFIFRHLAVMPDVHVGKGSTVGSVIPTRKAVIPAAVGVDLGCGMMAVKTSLRASELPDGVMVVAVRLVPKGDAPVKIWRSEFFLRSDKDGQRSEPYEPTQMAGGSVMSIGKVQQTTGTIMVQDQGPIWGGVGGSRPRRMGGDGSGIGNPTTGGVETNEVRTTETKGETDNKLLALLKEKVLPEGEISQPVSGLLYFPIEGKHKVKQMELHYRGNAAKLDLRFLKKNK
jgi:hypothetical protein